MKTRWARPTLTTWWAIGFAISVTFATAAYLMSAYDSIPFGVPVRFALGIPLIYQVKTPLMVMLPAAVHPALFAPTRTGIGWTLNFGRPLAIVLLAAVVILGIGGPYFLARYVLRGLGE